MPQVGRRRPVAGPDADSVDVLADLVMEYTDRAREATSPRLSHLQFQALTAIDRHGALNLGRLAELLFTAMSSTSRLCDRLEATGLIERHPREDNRREVVLSLSGDGRRLLAGLRAHRREGIARVLADDGQIGLTMRPALRSADGRQRRLA
ncbi:MarR family transcriptional regulator [Pilimelia terevasa]|uniref:MarR family transcriptional regulator n=1 Tax=Pilimelia terevasa TaxID=53372 RepID=A0A8J3BLQ1_9ACTN|nr:MarR family transcriptional regulator [Pilimelia terevasa]GGK28216.1 MarR family transcriptional regulator [Pilimelia terevasa]